MNRIKIAVLGAGNMGTAMAHVLAGHGHEVALWDFFPEVMAGILRHRENRRFLPGVHLHTGVHPAPTAPACVAGAKLVVVSVPSVFVGSTLTPVLPALEPGAVLLNVAKGFAPGTRQPLPLMLRRLARGHPCVHLAGPAIANELAGGLPAPVVLAAEDLFVAGRVAQWLEGPSFIPATTSDVAGAALGGILKNVYAILLGGLETLGGETRNLEAAVLSASVHEMAAIARAQGGRTATLYGLAGLGDLVATGFSCDSHNRKFGQMLASGRTVPAIAAETGWLPEGAQATATACALARAAHVRAPLAGLVRRWIRGAPPSLAAVVRVLRSATKPRS
jgi:glycerol-3-phosphate dehydrogenase (NAD(P)+)